MLPLLVPIIGQLLSNGLDLVANAALAKGKEFVEEKTGIKLEPNMSGETIAALKKAQMDHETELLKIRQEQDALAAHIEEIYVQDVQDARARDIEYVKMGRNNMRGDVLAYGALAALGLDIVLLFFVPVPVASRDLLLVTFGALVAIVKDVYGFEFGSSKDSARNAQAVVDSLKKANDA